MTHFEILLLYLSICAGIRFVLLQDSTNPFRWFPPDNFDIIASKMERANPENCVTMSESDLRLPPTALSQLPKYNQILSQQWFANRSKLLHLHNLALNRAFFYSYIQQRLDGPVIDPPFLPSLMYYYLSAAADVSSGPNVINTSAVLMDTNTTYANWYGLKVINHTLPLFGPMARRLDNWNDEMNFLRVPSNNTIKIYDMGAGPNSNYTAPWYKNNPYIRDREMGIEFIPDNRGTAPSKNQYTTKIQLATINGDPIEQLETGKFYGPNAPGMKETFLPVRFTRPYYDCGGTNRWIVSSVSALSDFMPRYSNITRLRGPRMVGIVIQGMDFYRIDFNPCAPGLGNPNHFLAGIARCKPTTLCVPLSGFGFRRGGYECVCQPGHRLPAGQIGPFRGVDIEVASKEEYENGFDCLPVGWREVIPEETGVQGTLQRRRRAASTIDVEYFRRLRESDENENQSGLLRHMVQFCINE
ncbi:G-protein-coupled receptor [Paragonimus heterotremus]|uniref:G-protein-coupled receptor n=1 Tax=Paragonimus heterotremus TaxID=100268 RepID=A0A8J4T2B7_9TREM|nr:G-protein-coupled receptor [Paragonimus heterotremus]